MRITILNFLICGILALLSAYPSAINAQTQQELNRQAAQDFEATDLTLNKVYNALMLKLDKGPQEQLKTAQRIWIKHRDAEAKMEADEEASGGSMYRLVYNLKRTELTKTRVKELQLRNSTLIVKPQTNYNKTNRNTYSGFWDGKQVEVDMEIEHGNVQGQIRDKNSNILAGFHGKNPSRGIITVEVGETRIDSSTYTFTKTDNGTSIVWTSKTKSLFLVVQNDWGLFVGPKTCRGISVSTKIRTW